jgi:hypothetical protein
VGGIVISDFLMFLGPMVGASQILKIKLLSPTMICIKLIILILQMTNLRPREFMNWSQFLETGQAPVLTPVILATQQAEIRRIGVRSQTGQIVYEALSQKKKGKTTTTTTKNTSRKRAGGMT